ncbi:MAG: DUF1549 domain-containing protein, partial [Planctomycetaceae bacterium]|nr:DUF1549 domain-containing protein [Planctomycetaceae bacterium]
EFVEQLQLRRQAEVAHPAANVVGETFLGHAQQCARCHDHEFDPVPTHDYYSIQSVFAPGEHRAAGRCLIVVDRSAIKRWIAEQSTTVVPLTILQIVLSPIESNKHPKPARRSTEELNVSMRLPEMIRLRQTFARPVISDVPQAVREQLAKLALERQIQPGQRVAVTVGSRGITGIATIIRSVVDYLKELGAEPFLVPAMGSHGGATAQGQVELIAQYGITEESMSVPILSSMATVIVGELAAGIPVHFDRHAFEADHVLVVGRVKPHTMFVGDVESGLHKMLLIGLGKHAGALTYHRAIKEYSFDEIIRAVAGVVLERCRIVAGLAIVENAYDETALIEGVAPADFHARESKLLAQAKAWLPQLPFPKVDLLIVDQIGKEISGTGMDTNIVGRKYNDHVAMPGDRADCKRIFIRGLTEQTHGNACGIGLAEFTLRRAVEQMDREYTMVNCITSGHPTAGMIPLVYDTDREVIENALQTIGLTPPDQARVIRIRDTLHLDEVYVSTAYASEWAGREDLQVLTAPAPIGFDTHGDLNDPL